MTLTFTIHYMCVTAMMFAAFIFEFITMKTITIKIIIIVIASEAEHVEHISLARIVSYVDTTNKCHTQQ